MAEGLLQVPSVLRRRNARCFPETAEEIAFVFKPGGFGNMLDLERRIFEKLTGAPNLNTRHKFNKRESCGLFDEPLDVTAAVIKSPAYVIQCNGAGVFFYVK